MTDERYKQIMSDLGMPNSSSLLAALQQVANETAQTVRKQVATECAKICEDMKPPNVWLRTESSLTRSQLLIARLRSKSGLGLMPGLKMTEEQYCLQMLVELRESYARYAKPYLDRLIAIECMKSPSVTLIFHPDYSDAIQDTEGVKE